MPAYDPTPEQQAVITAAHQGGNVVVTAGAGAGKTSTMQLLAESMPDRRMLYGAFNRAAKEDAARRFPGNVKCVTSSALARLHLVNTWGSDCWNARMDQPRQYGQQVASILRIFGPHRISEKKVLAPQQVARIAMETVTNFCYSADDQITAWHVPKVNGAVFPDERKTLTAVVVPLAQRAWTELCKPWGELKLTFDHAMKMWGLSGQTRMPYDVVIVDEAQDTNPVWGKIVSEQDCQIIVVGDSNQAIYGWRGAVDAMGAFPADHHLQLTQSWRFGQAIADEANKWLALLESDLRIKGNPNLHSRIDRLIQADAVLCRTNAEAMSTVMDYQDRGINVGLVGGGEQIERLAKACLQLKESGGTSHPELCAFTSWGQVQEYVADDHGGSDLAVFVKLIDNYGPQAVIAAASKTVDENDAEAIVSTAHKSKGREWPTVRIAGDFPEPRDNGAGLMNMPSDGDLMLAYVAVTRARDVLDRTGLSWVDQLLHEVAPTAPPVPPPTAFTARTEYVASVTGAPAPAHTLPVEYRVVDAAGTGLCEWTGNYPAACSVLRSHATADRIETRTPATTAA